MQLFHSALRHALSGLVAMLAIALIHSAAAAPRDEAKRHFKGGMQLVADGNLDGGIAELEIAYDILPHPNVLFNIGRALADAERFEDALVYFRRYVDSGPPDATDVQALIDVIVTQLAENQRQAEKEEITIDGEVSAEQMNILMELADRLQTTADRIDTGPRGGASAGFIDGDLSTEELLASKSIEGIYEETVVSAARKATSPLDAPVSTTIITADDIRLSGMTNIPDLLRSVAGMEVMAMGSGNANIGIRGFNQRMANKVLVLVDGRSVCMDFVGATFFQLLDVNLADIERIEVIRGPGSTMYGANAFSGVVNIITKQIGARDAEVNILGGMGETVQGNVRFSDRIGTVGYGLSVGYEQTDRFELEYDPERTDMQPVVDDPTLAVRALRLNGGINWLPRRDTSFALTGGMSSAFDDFYAIGQLRNLYGQGTMPWGRIDARYKGLAARAYYNHYSIDVGPAWMATGSLDSLNTHLLSNIIDAELSYGSDVKLGVPNHISVGVGFRVKTVDWAYLDDEHMERHLNGFIEDRITFFQDGEKFDSLAAVLGFRFDQHPLVGFTPSPRVALIAKPTAGTAIRASAGTAFRIPTFMESYLEVMVPSPYSGVGYVVYGDTQLKPERIQSAELGFRFEGSDYFMFDIAGYYQRVNDFIRFGPIYPSLDAGTHDVYGDQFVGGWAEFENVDQPFAGFGVEPTIHLFPVDGLDISINYAFNYVLDLDKFKAGEDARDVTTPLHKLNAGVQYRSPINLDFNVNVHVVSAYAVPDWTYEDVGGLVPANVLTNLEVDPYVMLNARIILRLLDDRLDLGVTGFNLNAFGDKEGGHKEHEFGTHIGPRIYGSLGYKF